MERKRQGGKGKRDALHVHVIVRMIFIGWAFKFVIYIACETVRAECVRFVRFVRFKARC